MKIALVHDWLNVKQGGAESVFFEIANLYPDADLHTLVYNPKLFGGKVGERNISTSFLQLWPGFIKHRPKFLLPFIPRAIKSLNLDEYDVIISSSSAWAKNISKHPDALHICYCHTPARMLWDYWPRYLDDQKIGPFRAGAVTKFFITHTVSKLRLWDFYGSGGVNHFVTNSNYITGRVEKFYRRAATKVYPPVDVSSLHPKDQIKKEDYFLVLSVLSRYKNIDLVIEAFRNNHMPLRIAGDGPDINRLKSLSDGASNIEFLGRVSQTKKVELLQKARALIFANVEDFGITPVEAMAAGTPVIARAGGGVEETVVQDKTGVFFDQDNASALQGAISGFEKLKFDPKVIYGHAAKFSATKFRANFKEKVDEYIELHNAKK